MRLLHAIAAITLLAAACGLDLGGTAEPAGIPVPADGSCQTGVVVQAGERCTHEFFYQIGFRIGSDGSEALIESVSNVFRVDSDGIGHYGDRLAGTNIESTIDLDGELIRFAAYARDDGSFYIEEASRPGRAATATECSLGMTLSAGERCLLPNNGGEFSVDIDGVGCLGGSICSGRAIQIKGFSVERTGDVWTIAGLP